MYIIVIAVVGIGAWLLLRKGSNQPVDLYSPSASPTASATATMSPTPISSPAGKLTKLSDGLEIQDEVIGQGAAAKAGDTIAVQYTGTLSNGTKFDSSYDHGQPFSFQLGAGQVIKGWDEGVAGMKVGGKRKLVIPPSLGYGSQNIGNGLIPPNSTLLFEIELVAIQ